MCNLNILIQSKKTKKIYQLINFLECATTESYLYNNDGDGVYFDYSNNLIRSKNKIALNEYSKDISKSKFIISHQRLATHGKTFHYTQPFRNNGFVFVHNGILSNYDFNNNKSDSYNFFTEFVKDYKKSKEKTREQRIVKSLYKLLSKSDGSFSIALFDVKEQRLYYVKNFYTDINFFRTKDKKLLYITTRELNKAYFKLYTSKIEKLNVKSNKIYRIYLNKDNVLLKYLGDIVNKKSKQKDNSKGQYITKPLPKVVSFFRTDNQSTMFNFDNIIDFKYFRRYFGFYSGINRRKCGICGETTYNKNRHNPNVVFCNSCIGQNHEAFLTKFKDDNPALFYV